MSQIHPLVQVHDVQFYRRERPVLDGVELAIPQGQVTAIMGPSGCGKTTLLKLIGGQLAPEQGQVLFNGYDVHQQSRRQLYELRKHMGLMFQSGGLFTNFNVFDNVAFPLREHTSMEEPLIRDLVLLKLEAVGLRGAKSLQIDELSGGMARRVAMARALALDPALMMYDEPFTGQDPIMMGGLVKLIRHLNDMLGLTSVVVSHDVHETASIADYVYIVSGGRVIGQGAPKKILRDDNPAVYQFMHGLADGVIPFHYPTCSLKEDLLGD